MTSRSGPPARAVAWARSRARGHWRQASALVGGVAAAVSLAGCGIPSAGAPVAIPASQIPYHLENGPTPQPTIAPTGVAGSHRIGFVIYLLENNVLVPVRRLATRTSPQLALDALEAGPTTTEFDIGLSSALVLSPEPTLRISSPITKSGLARVALDTSTASLADPVSLFEALGQIVWTLTQFCSVQEVSFTYGGNPFPAFLPNGTAPSKPVTQADYLEIAPPVSARAHHPTCTASVPGP